MRSAPATRPRAATAAGGTRLQGLWAQIGAAGTSAIIVPAAARRQAPARARGRSRPGAADRRRDGHRHRAARHLPRHAGGGLRSRATTTPFTRTLELQLDGCALHHRRLARRHARGGRTRLVGGARLLRRRRSAPRERRPGGRDRLRAERLPDEGDDGRDRDDGRRRLLGRHRQRRLARPVRRQLLCGRRPRLLAGRTAGCPAAPSSTTSRGGSPTSAARPEPACSSAATAASRATSTATAPPTSTSPLPATTPCSGTTARATSARAPAPPASPPGAGTPAPPSADVNGDGRPDIFVSGYADVERSRPVRCRVPEQLPGRPRPALPQRPATTRNGHARFREVGEKAAHRQRHARARARRRVHATRTATAASTSTSRTTPTRTGST